MSKPSPNPHHVQQKQDDDLDRKQQRSHGDHQNRSKKDGSADQVGTGQDQTSGRHRGGGARRQEP